MVYLTLPLFVHTGTIRNTKPLSPPPEHQYHRPSAQALLSHSRTRTTFLRPVPPLQPHLLPLHPLQSHRDNSRDMWPMLDYNAGRSARADVFSKANASNSMKDIPSQLSPRSHSFLLSLSPSLLALFLSSRAVYAAHGALIEGLAGTCLQEPRAPRGRVCSAQCSSSRCYRRDQAQARAHCESFCNLSCSVFFVSCCPNSILSTT